MGKGSKRQSAATGESAQFLDLVEQIKHQRAARQVDAQIVVQPHCGLHPFDGDKGKAPFTRRIALGGDKPFVDHVVDDFRVDAAESAEIGKRAAGFFIEDHALDVIL